MNLWHNPAVITGSSYTTSFASFLLNSGFPAITVGAVINNFPTGRQQVCDHYDFFLMKYVNKVDGVLHYDGYRLESDFKLIDPCLDSLGNEGFV